jgi:hypothetical protein
MILSRLLRRVSKVGAVAVLVGAMCSGAADAAAPGSPVSFSGPLGATGVRLHAPAQTSQFNLAPYGYTEQEYLASSANVANQISPNSGRWPGCPGEYLPAP